MPWLYYYNANVKDVIDGKNIYIDENTNSPSVTKFGTEITLNDGSSVKVLITDSSGGTFHSIDPNVAGGLPANSDQWYTPDPQNSGQYILIDFGDTMGAQVNDMVGLMNSIYSDFDTDNNPSNGIQIDPSSSNVLQDLLEDAAINGKSDGSIPGLHQLTGQNVTTDLDAVENGIQSIESIVEKHVSEGMTEFNGQTPGAAGNKTIDEIFRDAIEETIHDLESYDPDIFSGT